MNYQAYLFDWDGTLADTLSRWLQAYRDIFAHHGIDISDQEIGNNVIGDWEFYRKYDIPNDHVISDRLMQVTNTIQDISLNPHAQEVITALHNHGKKLAIVSSSAQVNITPILGREGWEHIFDSIVTADNVTAFKPDPQPILQALDQLQVSPHQAVMIGDTKHDINAGNNAGVDTVLLHNPSVHGIFYHKQQLLESQPTVVVEDLIEILSL